ncbi:MAG: hypothetical protein QE487_07505 [Fluviicola sp.]|nr:hypothetical protein [Fluviicola sp.]
MTTSPTSRFFEFPVQHGAIIDLFPEKTDMKRAFFGLVGLIVFTSCGTPSDREAVSLPETTQQGPDARRRLETEELQPEIREPEAKSNISDSAVNPVTIVDTPVEQPVLTNNDKGSVHYFTGTQKVAVRITPWKNNQREVICYAINGEVTFTFEDVRRDYTVFTEVVSFHENGAANRIHVSSNPGASLYYYETNYTFDEENYPLQKEEIEYPQTLDKMLDNVRTWNREKRVWL